MDFCFDPRLELDREPLGAVEAGTAVRFGIRAGEHLNIKEMLLEVFDDDTGQSLFTPMEAVWTEKGFTRFKCTFTPEKPGLFWYRFRADGMAVGKTPEGAGFSDSEAPCWQLTVYSPEFTTPDWIKGGVFYHIFVDRFNKKGELPLREGAIRRDDWGGTPEYRPDAAGEIRNCDFFGGNLEGIIEKLPYLAQLGVTCIYLSPIFEAASNHKYDTGNYMKIDPSFGDEETFSRLCETAMGMGIRIICDGVFNHTGDDSVYFDRYGRYGGNGAYSSESSPYFNWYSFSRWPDEYESWWGIKTLPQVREDDESYRRYILGPGGVIEKWTNLGASGWRLDVADELTEGFIRQLRTKLKALKDDALIIGEVWEDASNKIAYGYRRHYFDGTELDGVMNYPFKEAIISYMLNGNAQALRESVETICENYPKPALDCLMNGLGSHDTPRILTVLSGKQYESRDSRANAKLSPEERQAALKKLYPAALLQFTLPGVPCIFYGDETGMEGYEDPFNRRCFPWGQEGGELGDWYKKLASVRKSHSVYTDGDCRVITARDGVFVFSRGYMEKKIYSAVNASRETRTVTLPHEVQLLISQGASIENGELLLQPCGCAIYH